MWAAGGIPRAVAWDSAGPVRDGGLWQHPATHIPGHPPLWHAEHPPQPAAEVARRGAGAPCD